MKNIELKPCPLCGGKAHFIDLGEPGKFEDWDVECKDCGATLICPGEEPGAVSTKEEAAAAWNRRDGVNKLLSEERVAGQKEAWELAGMIARKFCMTEYEEIFGVKDSETVYKSFSYAEAAEKVVAWEESTHFKAGDVVRTKTCPENYGNMIVIGDDPLIDGGIQVLYGKFLKTTILKSKLKKADHIQSVEDWLKKIGGEENDI